jgi:guanylate kinase
MELSGSPAQHVPATPHLTRLAAFDEALKNYHIGESAGRTLHETRFAVMLGPTSSGRNTIIERLVATGNYHFIISDTTRPPRVNNGVLEQDGVQYWFRAEDDMLADIQAGKFLEAEVIHRQQVSGISIRELEKAQANHRIAITDIDIGGVHNVVTAKPDAAVILILPPSFDEWRHRIEGRGHMSNDEWRRRATTALRIFKAPSQHDYFKVVVNDNLDHSVAVVDAIARTDSVDPAEQARGLRVAAELYQATKAALAQ